MRKKTTTPPRKPMDAATLEIRNQKVTDVIYREAGRLPKGFGAIYRFTRQHDRGLARSKHDCLALTKTAADDTDALECTLCGRLMPRERAMELIALRAGAA